MGVTSASSSLLIGDQSRKSRTTLTNTMKALAAVMVIFAFGQVFQFNNLTTITPAVHFLEDKDATTSVSATKEGHSMAPNTTAAIAAITVLDFNKTKSRNASLTAPVDYSNGTEYCPLKSLHNTTKPFELSYFQEVAKTNEELAVAARPFSRSRSPSLASDPWIPHRLIFTHQYNLFDCESSRIHLTPTLHMLAANARQTVALYREFWGEPAAEVAFLTDMDCLRVLNATEPRLIKHFKKEKGMFKADLCRVAELYQNGGYYFDVDLLAVHPVSPADSVRFATVRGTNWPSKGFFQAFAASAPGHPILKRSLDILLEVYEGKRKRHFWIGPETMQIAYEQYLNETSPEVVSRDLLLLDEMAIKHCKGWIFCPKSILTLPKQPDPIKPFRTGVCNHVVYDHSTQYFFSRVNGTAWCGARPGGFPQDQSPAILPPTIPPNTTILLNPSSLK